MNRILLLAHDVLPHAICGTHRSNPSGQKSHTTVKRKQEMALPVKKANDVVRIQFDVRRAHLDLIDELQEACGLETRKELFNNAVALMKWAVQARLSGRRIASYDPVGDDVEVVALPALDLVGGPEAGRRSKSHAEGTPATMATNKPRLGVVTGDLRTASTLTP